MSPMIKPNDVSDYVPLTDEQIRKRCCCGLFQLYGPDSAYSWMVAFSNFLIHFLVVGLGRMSGILYVDFMTDFGVDRSIASIPFSVQQASRNLFGPVAGIVGEKFGLRNMTIFGGVAAFVGAAVLFFELDMTYIILFWGLIFGIGAAFTTTLNQISIDQCFDRNRATAGGFAVSGGCVGAFIFPFVLESGILHYDLKGTFLLIGSLLLFTIPAAFMLVEPPWKPNRKSESYRQNIRNYGTLDDGVWREVVDACNSGLDRRRKELLEPSKHKARIDWTVLRGNRDIVFQLLTREISSGGDSESAREDGRAELENQLERVYSIVEGSSALPGGTPQNSTELEKRISVDNEEIKVPPERQPLSERELFAIQSKLQKLYERGGSRVVAHFHYDDQPKACKILTELRKLYEVLTGEPGFENIYNKAQYFRSSRSGELELGAKRLDPSPSNSFCSHFKTAVKLHKKPVFLLICLCRAVFMLTFVPVLTVVVDFAMDQGLDKSYGKYAVSALSLGDLLGRVGFGWVTDRKYLSQPRYTLIAMILLAGNSALLPFLHSGWAILAAVLVYGALQGSLFIRHPMLVSQFMTDREQSIGMGCINLLSGIVGFGLPAFIGYFRDTLGSYNQMFYLNAIMCIVVGLLWGLERFFPAASTTFQNRYQQL